MSTMAAHRAPERPPWSLRNNRVASRVENTPAPSWTAAYLVGLAWVATAVAYLVVTW